MLGLRHRRRVTLDREGDHGPTRRFADLGSVRRSRHRTVLVDHGQEGPEVLLQAVGRFIDGGDEDMEIALEDIEAPFQALGTFNPRWIRLDDVPVWGREGPEQRVDVQVVHQDTEGADATVSPMTARQDGDPPVELPAAVVQLLRRLERFSVLAPCVPGCSVVHEDGSCPATRSESRIPGPVRTFP